MTAGRQRPDVPQGLTLGPLLQWVMDLGVGREQSNQPGKPIWTQAALAQHLNVDASQIRRWLRKENIGHEHLEHFIHRLLGHPPSWPELADELKAARHRSRGTKNHSATLSTIAMHNLPLANPDFVGRLDVLAALRKLLTDSTTAAITQTRTITGLGGVGKTQTALAYAYQHCDKYQLIWWLRSESPSTLAADYMGLAQELGLDPGTRNQNALIASIRSKLQSASGWLLIFDNVEDPSVLDSYAPRNGSGHVLITSRRTNWRGIARSLQLNVLSLTDSLAILIGGPDHATALKPDELKAAKDLARDLGLLPLALAQAAAYLEATGIGFLAYRQRLKQRRTDFLARGRPPANYPRPVALTWQASIDAAERESPGARSLLEILAFFAPDAIPRTLLNGDPAALPDDLRDTTELDEAVAALAHFSLVQVGQNVLTVHRLVQKVVRDNLSPDVAQSRAECAVRLASVGWPTDLWDWKHTQWLEVQILLPHALVAADAASTYFPGLALTSSLLDRAATFLQVRGAYAEAASIFVDAVAAAERALGPEHAEVGSRLNNLALVYDEMGRFAEAEPLYMRAISIGEDTLGSDHPNLADRVNNLALLYDHTGRLSEAERLYKRAIAIGEKALGSEHFKLSIWLNNLADLYRMMQRFSEAESLYERALAIGEKSLGREHYGYAICLHNLALLYRDIGRYSEAESNLDRAISINEQGLGLEHPRLGRCLLSRASVLLIVGRDDNAKVDLRRAKEIFEQALGASHPWTVEAVTQLSKMETKHPKMR